MILKQAFTLFWQPFFPVLDIQKGILQGYVLNSTNQTSGANSVVSGSC